jgi:exopolysaccharide biosynthesis polyprenyl glycosylphosphotransferase
MFTIDRRRRLAIRALQAWDLGMLGIALVIAWRFGHPTDYPPLTWSLLLWFLVTAILWHASLARADFYTSRRLSGISTELWDGLKGISLGTVFLAASGMVLRVEFVTPRLVEIVWFCSFGFFVAGRGLLRTSLAFVRRAGRNLRFVLVVGSGSRAQGIIRKLEHRPELGYRVCGYIDEVPEATGDRGKPIPGVEYLGDFEYLSTILARNVIDEVLIMLPMKSYYAEIAKIIRQCEAQGIHVRLLADFFDLALASPHIEMFDGTPVLGFATNGVRGWYAFVKRTLDIVVALTLLITLSPLLLIIAWLIKRDDAGPVFFVQERVGLQKRGFGLIKFRTMIQNSEALLQDIVHLNEADGAVFKIRNDPRVTRIGRFLRRASLDELPQLINVLKGEMSLVGPRPLPLRDVKGFTADWQRRRFSVRPGITGLWQVSGRSSISFNRWMELDMAYIDSSCFGLDMKILFRTVPAVLRGTGAY